MDLSFGRPHSVPFQTFPKRRPFLLKNCLFESRFVQAILQISYLTYENTLPIKRSLIDIYKKHFVSQTHTLSG